MTHYDYFLEYEDKAEKVLDFLEWETDIEFDYEWYDDVLIIYTDVDVHKVESMVYDATGAYANNYGDSWDAK